MDLSSARPGRDRTAWLASLTAFAVVVCIGCSKSVCHRDELEKVVSALSSVPANLRPELAAAGVAESCGSPERPMPPGLAAALKAQAGYGPHARLGVLKGIVGDAGLFAAACPAGPGALVHAARIEPGEASLTLASACRSGLAALGSDGEFDRAPFHALALGLATHHWMTEGGVSTRVARRLARALIGVD